MKSDHWNFLANLLGTPGPAKSQEEKKNKKVAASDSDVEQTAATSDPSQDSSASPVEATAGEAQAESSQPTSSEAKKTSEPDFSTEIKNQAASNDDSVTPAKPITREDVLDALTSTEPPKILPGFGLSESDNSDTGSESASLDQLTGVDTSNDNLSLSDHPTLRSNAASQVNDTDSDQEQAASIASTPAETAEGEEDAEAGLDTWGQLASQIGFASHSRESIEEKPLARGSGDGGQDDRSKASESASKANPLPPKASSVAPKTEASQKDKSLGGFGAGLGFDDDLSDEDEMADNHSDTIFESGDKPKTSAADELTPSATSELSAHSESESELPGGWATFSSNPNQDASNDRQQTHTEDTERPSRRRSPRGKSGDREDGRDGEKSQQRETDRRRRYRDEDEDGEPRPRRGRSSRSDGERLSEERGSRNERRSREGDRRDDGESTEESGEGRRRRGRGRRGARQRISDEQVQGMSDDSDLELNHQAGDDSSEDRQRGSRRRSQHRDDRVDDEDRGRRSRRSEGRAKGDERDSDREDEVQTRRTEGSKEESEEESSTRGRRRGRRGRGGRSRRDQEKLDLNEGSSDIDPLQRSSAFDDDHEDDHEMEEIRRGQRSGNRNRNRDEDERSSNTENRGRRRRRSNESDDSERNPRSRKDRNADSTDESRGKRTTIPSWLETVDLLVNANIENHKKSKNGRNRSSKKR